MKDFVLPLVLVLFVFVELPQPVYNDITLQSLSQTATSLITESEANQAANSFDLPMNKTSELSGLISHYLFTCRTVKEESCVY